MSSLQAAVVREIGGAFKLEKVELDEPRADEILIRIVATGVCHTDMVVRDQHLPTPLPAVLGHEGAGVVERVGALVKKVQPGDHVVLTYAACGQCHNCQQGLPAYCPEILARNFAGGRMDGSSPYCGHGGERISGCFFGQSSFGEYAIATERNVVKIRKDVPLEIMGPLGCGIQTGAGAVINALKPTAGTSIAIFGTGSVGLAGVMAARLVGCAIIIAVDLNPSRLALARELGATHTVDAGKENVVEAIQKITGDGAQYSLECTGIPAVFRQAVDCLRLTGVCGLIGVAPLGTEIALDMNTILFGRTVRGIVEGDSVPDIFIPQMIELWRTGKFPFDRLITFYPLSKINEAVQDSEKGKVLKAIVRPGN